MDAVLHGERVDGWAKRTWRAEAVGLPDGTMIADGGQAFALRGGTALPWSFAGYAAGKTLPKGQVDVLTPPAMVDVLREGFEPVWHPGAVGARGS
jgi:hypothetical protein